MPDSQASRNRVPLQRVERIRPAMSVGGLGLCDCCIVRDQSHLDGNLPRGRVCVWADQKAATAFREPFGVYSSQDTYRVIKVLKDVRDDNVVKEPVQSCCFEGRMDECNAAAKSLPSLLDRQARGLNTSHVIESRQKTLS